MGRARLGLLAALAAAALPGCLPQGGAGGGSRLERQVQELRDEVYLLRRQREELDRRLAELEARMGGTRSAATPAARPEPETPRQPPKTAAFDAPVVPAARDIDAGPEPAPGRAVLPAAAGSSESAYSRGLTAYKQADYRSAVELLAAFVYENPAHADAAEAQFFVAEAYLAEANFPQAIVEYQKVVDGYKSSERVPAALYGIGLSYYELNYYSNALTFLDRLVSEHPKSPLVKEAKPLIERARRRVH